MGRFAELWAPEQRAARGASRLLGCLAVLVLLLLVPSVALGSTTLDIRGSYVGTSAANGANYSIGSVVDTENCAAGTFSGRGVSNGQTYSNFTGTISGDLSANQITTHEVYTNVNYTADGVSSAALDPMGRLRLQGTFSDSYGQTGTADTTRISGPPNDGGCGSTKKLSATSVQCNYDTFMQSFSCTAQVADASGTQPPHTPTGPATFALDPGADGSFPQGSTCTLQPSGSGPTAYCSVTYVPGQQGVAAGTQPKLSATYSGDSTFASSSGHPANQYATPPTPPRNKDCAAGAKGVAHSVRAFALPHALALAFGGAGSVSVPALTVQTRGTPKKGRTLTRVQADRRALALLRPARAPGPGAVTLYGLAKSLRAGSVLTEARLGARMLLPALRVRARAWVYWEDLSPLRRFTHPSVVLVIAGKGGRVLAHANFVTYPQVNGHAAAFVTALKPHVLYRRGSRRHRPIRLSAAALKRLVAAERATKALVKANASQALAHISDVSKSALITLVDHHSRGRYDTFVREETAITDAFAAHGVPTQSTADVVGLGNAVNDAAAAGRTSVTIFLDGHGAAQYAKTPPDQMPGPGTFGTEQPTIYMGAGGPPPVTSSDLAKIVEQHPDIKFNFIIDSCYSGRFVDPLSVEANVASVTTSSSADQQSGGPVVLGFGSSAALGDTPFFQVPDVGIKGGARYTNIYVNPDEDPRALSSFTTGEVAALKQAWIGKGSDTDVTAVVQDARTLEPTFDVAAAAGLTNPSPDPTPGAMCPAPAPDPVLTGGWFTGP